MEITYINQKKTTCKLSTLLGTTGLSLHDLYHAVGHTLPHGLDESLDLLVDTRRELFDHFGLFVQVADLYINLLLKKLFSSDLDMIFSPGQLPVLLRQVAHFSFEASDPRLKLLNIRSQPKDPGSVFFYHNLRPFYTLQAAHDLTEL